MKNEKLLKKRFTFLKQLSQCHNQECFTPIWLGWGLQGGEICHQIFFARFKCFIFCICAPCPTQPQEMKLLLSLLPPNILPFSSYCIKYYTHRQIIQLAIIRIELIIYYHYAIPQNTGKLPTKLSICHFFLGTICLLLDTKFLNYSRYQSSSVGAVILH